MTYEKKGEELRKKHDGKKKKKHAYDGLLIVLVPRLLEITLALGRKKT